MLEKEDDAMFETWSSDITTSVLPFDDEENSFLPDSDSSSSSCSLFGRPLLCLLLLFECSGSSKFILLLLSYPLLPSVRLLLFLTFDISKDVLLGICNEKFHHHYNLQKPNGLEGRTGKHSKKKEKKVSVEYLLNTEC